jgi:exodeoxyribonuclease-3
MKVATWNVNGIRARMDQLTSWVAEERPDVICLQEIKAAPDQLGDSLFAMSEYVNYWHGAKGGYSGVSLHVRRGLFAKAPEFYHPAFDAECRIVVGAVEQRLFASVYVPNGGKDYDAKLRFFEELVAWAGAVRASGKELVLCGDLNIARLEIDVHPGQRDAKAIGQRPEERALFERLIAAGLVDVQRSLAPEDDRLFTWWPYWRQAREKNVGWRIDYVLAAPPLAERAAECMIRRTVGTSDHAPLVAMFGDAP